MCPTMDMKILTRGCPSIIGAVEKISYSMPITESVKR
jgi:hypothetical protein